MKVATLLMISTRMEGKTLKKTFKYVMLLALVLSVVFTVAPVNADVHWDEITDSIEQGVPWLAARQNGDGSWGGSNRVARTGMAVIKLIDYAEHDLGIAWTDPSYIYKTRIENGLNYLFSQARTVNPPNQLAGDPDSNNNDIAVYFNGHQVYEPAIGTMAIAATKEPTMVVANGPLAGWTYAEVVQDCVDYLAYAQCEDVGPYPARGGWGYGVNAYSSADNSVSGYASLALGYAKNHDESIVIPDFVLTELEVWISRIQHSTGYSYYRPYGITTYGDLQLKTGNLLYEMALVGYPIEHARVQLALNWLESNWGMRDYQRAYCLMKGLEAYDITDEISVGATGDWYNETATWIVAQQLGDGSWPRDPHDYSSPYVMTSSWALLTLEKATAPPANVPPVADAGPDQTLEQTSLDGAVAELSGAASYDPDGDPLTYAWSYGSSDSIDISALLPLGTTELSLTVSDGKAEDSDSVLVTVVDTTPPVLVVPVAQTVEQADLDGTGVPLEASATDICDTDVAISNDAPAVYPLGETIVTFVATDDSGNSATATTIVTVADSEAPEVSVCEDVTVEQASAAGSEVTLTGSATDICDAELDYAWYEGATLLGNDEELTSTFNLGTHVVTLIATDDSGNEGSADVTVTVEDTTPPEISVVLDKTTLWPPNHKYHDVVATITVSDICDVDVAQGLEILSVTSNEPVEAKPVGDGNTIPDWEIVDLYHIKLRAERQGVSTGRIYTITYRVVDASGNASTEQVTVTVEHDQGDGVEARTKTKGKK